MLDGRNFGRQFGTDHLQAFIINEEAVKQLGFKDSGHAVGKRLTAVGKEGQVKSLKFKPRVSVAELQDRKTGNKPGDGDALILSTISALTAVPVDQLKRMDSGDDYDVCGSISVFFM